MAELGFSEHQPKAPVVLAGCQAALRQSRAEEEGGPLFITVMLLGTGLLLLLGLIRGREERPLVASFGLFALALGVVLFQRTRIASLFVPLPPMGLRRAREVAEFIYPAAFVTFVGYTVPAKKRWLFALAAGCIALGVVVLGLESAGLTSLQFSVSLSSGLALMLIFIVLVHLARSTGAQPAARQLLAARHGVPGGQRLRRTLGRGAVDDQHGGGAPGSLPPSGGVDAAAPARDRATQRHRLAPRHVLPPATAQPVLPLAG